MFQFDLKAEMFPHLYSPNSKKAEEKESRINQEQSTTSKVGVASINQPLNLADHGSSDEIPFKEKKDVSKLLDSRRQSLKIPKEISDEYKQLNTDASLGKLVDYAAGILLINATTEKKTVIEGEEQKTKWLDLSAFNSDSITVDSYASTRGKRKGFTISDVLRSIINLISRFFKKETLNMPEQDKKDTFIMKLENTWAFNAKSYDDIHQIPNDSDEHSEVPPFISPIYTDSGQQGDVRRLNHPHYFIGKKEFFFEDPKQMSKEQECIHRLNSIKQFIQESCMDCILEEESKDELTKIIQLMLTQNPTNSVDRAFSGYFTDMNTGNSFKLDQVASSSSKLIPIKVTMDLGQNQPVIFFELELENINFSYLLAGHRSMAIPVGSCDYSSKITFQLRKEPIVQQMIEKKDFDDEGNTIFKYVKADPDSFTYWKLIDTEINIKNCKLDPDVLNPEKIQVRS